MKLLTHNLLMCNIKGCTINNFPLSITVIKSSNSTREFDTEVVTRTLKKIDLPALTEATKMVRKIYFNIFTI
jgi:multifunctional methyltransferase subunit TRM112